jgi:hypothetical protein
MAKERVLFNREEFRAEGFQRRGRGCHDVFTLGFRALSLLALFRSLSLSLALPYSLVVLVLVLLEFRGYPLMDKKSDDDGFTFPPFLFMNNAHVHTHKNEEARLKSHHK